MNKIRKFWNAFLAFYKGYAPTAPTEWDKDDILALRAFLQTRTGQRFKNSMILESYEQDRLATLERVNPQWSCGAATGFRLALLKIDEFTVVPAESEDEYESLRGLTASNRFDQHNR
jgi:hypothetical protein